MDVRYFAMIMVTVAATIVGAHAIGQSTGYARGHRDALAVDPVSEELEMVCAGLWVGEQNKKFWKKEMQK